MRQVSCELSYIRILYFTLLYDLRHLQADCQKPGSAPEPYAGQSSTGYLSDMELGHWVTGSMAHLGHLSHPGHRVIILTRCETRVFPVFEKMPKMQKVNLKCWPGYKYSYLLTYLVETRVLDKILEQYKARFAHPYT